MKIDAYVSERHKKKKKRRRVLFGALAIFAAYFIFFGVVWFVLHTPIFRVDRVEVQGNNAVASADVISLLQADAAPQHHFFDAIAGFGSMFLWPDSLSSSTLAMEPELSRVHITKDYWSHTITVSVAERQPLGIWCYANGQCFWFDDQGVIFEKAGNTQGALILTVNDPSTSAKGLNQQVLDSQFTPNLVSLLNVVKESGLEVQSIDLADPSLEQVDVHTVNGPVVYFSLRFSADNDLAVVKSIMTQSDFHKLQYIDCTTENRVYYK